MNNSWKRLKLTDLLSVAYRHLQPVVVIEHCTTLYRQSYKYSTDRYKSVTIDIEVKFWLTNCIKSAKINDTQTDSTKFHTY